MIPILYGSVKSVIVSLDNKAYTDENGNVYTVLKTFLDTDTMGLGPLSDVIDGVVIEERNGIYELEMTYPISGRHYHDIEISGYIKAMPFVDGSPQLFEIYRITKPISGKVKIYGRHVSYRLSYNTVMPFKLENCTAEQVLEALKNNAIEDCPFDFWTDFTGTARQFKIGAPSTFRSCLGGTDGSVLDHWSGEYEWDNFNVKFHKARGNDNGVSIVYGKNLIDLTQDENIENTVTGVVPFWRGYDANNEEVLVTCDPVYSANALRFPFKRTVPLDFSSDFSEAPTPELLRTTAENYVVNNKLGEPEVDLRVSFIPLSDTIEYEHLKLLEKVNLCDTVHVEFSELGVAATAKVTRTEFDFIRERYKSITLGSSTTTNIATTIQSVALNPALTEINKSQTLLEQAINSATASIRGSNGGYVKVLDANGDGVNDEIVFLDEASGGDLNRAVNVWRWNMGGLGFSNHGYAGPYTAAITSGGEIVATLMTAGYLNADVIRAGTIALAKLDSATQSTITTAASNAANANNQEQLIYFSAASGTASVSAPTTWITDATSNRQNSWTTVRPKYNQSYPVLFVATQRKNMSGTVTCTTPKIDDTTTVIDGGHIITGSIDAGKISVTDLTGFKATIGGFQIDSTSIHSKNVAVTSNAANSVALSSADFNRTINGTQRTLRFAIGSKFGVAGDGTVYASGVNVSGAITATGGKIGKFSVAGADSYLSAGSGSTMVGMGGDQAFWAGGSNSNTAPFRVSYGGALVATNANISGNITATSLNVTNATITGKISGSAIDGAVAQATNATNAGYSRSLSSTASLTRANVNSATSAATSVGSSVKLGVSDVYTDSTSNGTRIRFQIGSYSMMYYPNGLTDNQGYTFYFSLTTSGNEIGLCLNSSRTAAYVRIPEW